MGGVDTADLFLARLGDLGHGVREGLDVTGDVDGEQDRHDARVEALCSIDPGIVQRQERPRLAGCLAPDIHPTTDLAVLHELTDLLPHQDPELGRFLP